MFSLHRLSLLAAATLGLFASLSSCALLPDWLPPASNFQPAEATITIQPSGLAVPTPMPTIRFSESFSFHATQRNPDPTASLIQKTAPATPTPPTTTGISSDLYFISQNTLMRFNLETNEMDSLASGVVDFSTSSDGQRFALMRSTNIAANASELFNLDVLDLKSNKITPLLKGIPRTAHLALSPDGKWIVFQQEGAQNTISILAVSDPTQSKVIGICNRPVDQLCPEMSWSTQSDALLWLDEKGLWLANRYTGQSRLLTALTYLIIDPKGATIQLPVQISELHWSPNERFVLAQIITEANVGWYAIYDIRQSRWVEVPDTFHQNMPFSANAGWMSDGSLYTVALDSTINPPLYKVKTWQVLATRQELLNSRDEIKIHALNLPEISPDNQNVTYQTLWAEQISNGMLVFGIIAPHLPQGLILTWLDLEDELSPAIVRLSMQADMALWSPDGHGVLLLLENRELEIVGNNNSRFSDLETLIGEDASHFQWIPAMARPQ